MAVIRLRWLELLAYFTSLTLRFSLFRRLRSLPRMWPGFMVPLPLYCRAIRLALLREERDACKARSPEDLSFFLAAIHQESSFLGGSVNGRIQIHVRKAKSHT